MPHALIRHPDFHSAAVSQIDVDVSREGNTLKLRYMLNGQISAVAIPARTEPARTHALWRHTCFEVFAKKATPSPATAGGGYWEFNFSPSTQWAAYSFTARREGMAAFEIAPPAITPLASDTRFELIVSLDLTALGSAPLTIGLSAVIEEASGSKSYWALRHPKGEADFHHADCFALTV